MNPEDDNTFFAFCEKNKIGIHDIRTMDGKSYFSISIDEFHRLEKSMMIFDSTNGGLVLGKLHVEGGIHMIKFNFKSLRYDYIGEMEGWEYLSSDLKSHEHKRKLIEINELKYGPLTAERTDFEIPTNCKLIDTKNIEIAVIKISYHGNIIINRVSTKNYINQIIEVEKKFNPTISELNQCSFKRLFQKLFNIKI